MAYSGSTIQVSCGKGGLTGAKNIDSIPNYMMVIPTRNIIYERNIRRKRGGTAHAYGSAYAGTPKIIGLKHVTFEDGTPFLLAATDDGDIYKNDTDKINGSALGTTLPYSMEVGENKVFIADGVNIPVVWTGAGNAATIHEAAADFTTFPVFQFLKHKRGLSERMCAINRRGLFMSKSYTASLDMEHFITGAMYFHIEPEDGEGLTGMIEIGSELVVFGKKRAYRLDDSSLDTSEWGLNLAQWNGGAASWRLIIKTPNDVIVMAEDGEVYSIVAVNTYGDYKLASLTRPSWMHDWIKDNVDLGEIAQFHGIYDPALKAVKIFVVKYGDSEVKAALLFYPEREITDAWMIHDNTLSASGYDASASCLVPLADGAYGVYTGDYVGEIWKLNQPTRSDNGVAFYGGFKTPPDQCEDASRNKHFNAGHITLDAVGSYTLKIRTWIDGIMRPTVSEVDMGGAGASLDEFMLDTDELAGSEIVDVRFKVGQVGKRIQYEFYNEGMGEDFSISSYCTDYKVQGNQGG